MALKILKSTTMNNNIGKKFGRLTIVERTEEKLQRAYLYKCECECGNIVYQRLSTLKNGHATSCGCYQKETVYEMNKRVNAGGTKNYPFTRKGDKGNKTGLRGISEYVQGNKTKYAVRLYYQGVEHRKKGFLNKDEALEYRKYLEETYLPEEKRPK